MSNVPEEQEIDPGETPPDQGTNVDGEDDAPEAAHSPTSAASKRRSPRPREVDDSMMRSMSTTPARRAPAKRPSPKCGFTTCGLAFDPVKQWPTARTRKPPHDSHDGPRSHVFGRRCQLGF